MSNSARSIFGKNVRAIRKALGLSLLNFSILNEISKASLVNIESARNGYNLNLLDKICHFTRYSIKALSDKNFSPSDDIREKLIKIYSKNNQFHTILNHQPEIVYAIQNKVLKNNFLDIPKEIREIKDYLKTFGWDYKGTSLSITLKRMPDLIEIRKHRSKKNTHLYLRKHA